MSTCEEIVSKLNSLDSKIDGQLQSISTLTDLVVDIDTKTQQTVDGLLELPNMFQEIFNRFVEVQQNQVNLGNLLKQSSENQISISENLFNVSNGIKNLGLVAKANNDSIKGLAMSNGSLPISIIQQIANIEAVTNALNEAILR